MRDEQQRWLLVLNVVFNLVMGFILPVNTIFITKNLHESLNVAGFVLMTYSLIMMVGNVLGGYLFDHYSHRGTLISGFIISIIGFLLLSFFHGWPIYAVLLALIGFGMGIAYTAINSYTAVVAEQHREQSTSIFNIMYLSANVGIALGTMSVSYIFSRSIFWTFFLPAVFFLTCLLIVAFRGHVLDGQTEKLNGSSDHAQTTHQKSYVELIGQKRLMVNLVLICSAVFIIWVGYSQWDSNMSVYMLDNHFSMHDYSRLFTINAASLIIVQPIMNHFANKIFSKLKYQIILGLFIMGSSFMILPFAQSYWQYIVSMITLTVGESITFPVIPAILNKFATERNRGRYQSFYVIFGSLGRAFGPFIGSLVVTDSSFKTLFYLIVIAIMLTDIGMTFVKEL